jgi:hypothetical protein
LHASESLKGVGCFNLLLSLKVFSEGGDLIFLEDVEIGHVYTDLLSYDADEPACRDDNLLLTGLILDLSGEDKDKFLESAIEGGLKEDADRRTEDLDRLKEFMCDNLNSRGAEEFMLFRDSFQEDLIGDIP